MEDGYLSDNGADCNAEAAEDPVEAVEETGEEQDGAATQAKPARKRPVQNPRPKLNKDRLASARGIPELLRMSREVRWRGKGHELQDLDATLSALEHWGHRLFPRMDSSNFFGQLEKLGMKREVQTYMRKLRMGLEDGGDDLSAEPDDGLLLEVEEREEEQPARLEEDPFSSLLATTTTSSQATPPDNSEEVSQELRERMERSRLQALERRRLRLAQQDPAPSTGDSGHAEMDCSEPHPSDCTSPQSSARESRGEPQQDEGPGCPEPSP